MRNQLVTARKGFTLAQKTAAGAGAMVATAAARADYAAITGAVDWADVSTAAGLIFAAIAGVYVFIAGGKKVVNIIRGV